jgi:hypothetical protein
MTFTPFTMGEQAHHSGARRAPLSLTSTSCHAEGRRPAPDLGLLDAHREAEFQAKPFEAYASSHTGIMDFHNRAR